MLSSTSNVTSNDALTKLIALLVHELKETFPNKINQVLEKIDKYHEEHKTLHDTVQRLSNEVEKHTSELTALKEMINTTKCITYNSTQSGLQPQHTLIALDK